MQSLFFVALFRKQTRDAVLDWVEWLMPARIPFLPLRNPPARAMHLFITGHIQAFQDGVARRAAARAVDKRWVPEIRAARCPLQPLLCVGSTPPLSVILDTANNHGILNNSSYVFVTNF